MRSERGSEGDEARARLPLRPLEFAILLALAEEDLHGYAIAKRIADRELGSVALAPGNLYGVLDRLIADGLIERRPAEPDARRRDYGIMPLGRRVAALETERLSTLVRTAKRLDLAPERPVR
jgi:DNA-binding PadR family transcriptional regulator